MIMRKKLLFALYLGIISTFSQFSNCQWGDFSLQGAQGYEIQCASASGDYSYGYTPCMSYALCNGQRYQSVYFNRNIGQCEYYLAKWDEGETIPQYSLNDNIRKWTFNYANGQTTSQCPQGIEFDIVWTCDESCQPFCVGDTTCGQINECKHTMSIRSVYACVQGPPPDDVCVWGNVDLRAAMAYEIPCIGFNEQFAYSYTPCNESALCDGQSYQATRFDRQAGQCQYYLAQWDNGITAPSYFNNDGNPLWEFNYKNGQITTQCADGIEFTANWMCAESCDPFCMDTTCSQVNECRYQMAVRSVLACVTPDTVLKIQNVSKIQK